MNIRIKMAVVLIAALILAALGLQGSQKYGKTQPLKRKEAEKTAGQADLKKTTTDYGQYNFILKTLDGQSVRLSDCIGKVVLVNIWAPWCKPCSTEIPGIIRLYRKYKTRGFEVIGVAVQADETDVRLFVEKFKMPWPVGIKGDITKEFRSYGLPNSYLFRQDGSLLKECTGFTHEEALRPLIEAALKEIPFSKGR